MVWAFGFVISIYCSSHCCWPVCGYLRPRQAMNSPSSPCHGSTHNVIWDRSMRDREITCCSTHTHRAGAPATDTSTSAASFFIIIIIMIGCRWCKVGLPARLQAPHGRFAVQDRSHSLQSRTVHIPLQSRTVDSPLQSGTVHTPLQSGTVHTPLQSRTVHTPLVERLTTRLPKQAHLHHMANAIWQKRCVGVFAGSTRPATWDGDNLGPHTTVCGAEPASAGAGHPGTVVDPRGGLGELRVQQQACDHFIKVPLRRELAETGCCPFRH